MDEENKSFDAGKRRSQKGRFLKKLFRNLVAAITYVPRLLADSLESDLRRLWTSRLLKERFRLWLAEIATVPSQVAKFFAADKRRFWKWRFGLWAAEIAAIPQRLAASFKADKSRFVKNLFQNLGAAIIYVPRLVATTFADDIKRFWTAPFMTKRVRIWVVGLAAFLLLLAVTDLFGRSVYHHFKEKRDQAQAQAFLVKGDYASATLSARETLLLNPNNVPASRVMAALADRSRSPAALDWRKHIVEIEPTIEDKLQLASAGLRYEGPPYTLTSQILLELAATATNLPDYQIVAASLAVSTHRLADAEAHFETAARLEPTNQLFELNLAVLRLGMTNETKAAASRALLEKMRMDPNLGAAALRALVVDRLAKKDVAAANEYSTELLASPQASLADRLQQLDILQQLKSGDFAARLQAVQQSVATNAPAVAQVAEWMQANNLLAGSLKWLAVLPASVQDQLPVRLALADGYMEGGDWPALRDFASQGNWADSEFLRLALLSRACSQLGKTQMAHSNWSAAVTGAGDHFGALTTLLGLTEQWKLPREQEDLLERIVKNFPGENWAQQALAQLYFSAGKTEALHQLYARLFHLFPTQPGYENNLAATSLLLKTNLTQAGKWAAEAYARSTNNPDVASTYAFALHMQDRDKDGLAVLQKFKPAQLERPSIALYYGVLLAATHNPYATTYLQIARTQGHLLPEEQQLLEQANQSQ